MTIEKHKTACFIGHQKLPATKMEQTISKLNTAIERLVEKGVTTFIASGQLGFDQIASFLILAKEEMGYDIHFVLVLPDNGQESRWTTKEKQMYKQLIDMADSIKYVPERGGRNGIKQHVQYMIDGSTCCVCALIHEHSETGRAVNYARERQLEVINVMV